MPDVPVHSVEEAIAILAAALRAQIEADARPRRASPGTAGYLSIREFAAAIGVSVATVDRMIARNDIISTRPAGRKRRLIPATEVSRIMAGKPVPGAER